MDFPEEDYSSDEEGPDSGVQLLHVASLEMNGISNEECQWKRWMVGGCVSVQ